uniref:Secreted protein n=1 Tax=Steinernema glaseri TaxID=37863 RepID=A0A1I7ZUQ7_9BILA
MRIALCALLLSVALLSAVGVSGYSKTGPEPKKEPTPPPAYRKYQVDSEGENRSGNTLIPCGATMTHLWAVLEERGNERPLTHRR